MFDDIDIEIECPYCGRMITGFQTKSGACILKTYHPGDKVSDFDSYDGKYGEPKEFYCYSSCDHEFALHNKDAFKTMRVKKWVECDVNIPVIDHVICEDKSKWKIRFKYNEGNNGPCYIGFSESINQYTVDDFNEYIALIEYDKLLEFDLFKV